ncbi:MAG: serine/threonine-protein kinase [Myxococcota bacterium]
MSNPLDPMPHRSGSGRPPSDDDSVIGGRYELVARIAEGGNAVVHRAWDRETREWRAVKMLLPEYAKRQTLLSRFQREGQTMMRLLEHPNICRVYDAGVDADRAWLVMEYAEGGSVISWVERNGPMPPHMATEVAIQLCAGIAYAHQEGVIHRDVKPQNLLVDRDGRCKVTDFGIAQLIQQTRVTMTGTVMGTIGYIAPEQHESAKHADQRADVYSIAASVYTLVHGEAATHLFMAEDRDFDGIPEPLAAVIRKGAQYRRESRYQTVAEMQAAFESLLDVLEPDPPGTPPIVPQGIELPDLTHSPAPIEEQSLEPAAEILRTPLVDRTPSSIIPRDSLTGSDRAVRRARVRNRDELERGRRVRMVVLGVGAVGMSSALLLLFFSIVASVMLGGRIATTEGSSDELRDELEKELRLVDRRGLDRPEELEAQIMNATAGWDDKTPDERISDATHILETIRGRASELTVSGRADSLPALLHELREADKRLSDVLTLYESRSDSTREMQDSWIGLFARPFVSP